MRKSTLLRTFGTATITASLIMLGAGTAFADGITSTGPWSHNSIYSQSSNTSSTTNNNNVSLNNQNQQIAMTGSVTKNNNTGNNNNNPRCDNSLRNNSWMDKGQNKQSSYMNSKYDMYMKHKHVGKHQQDTCCDHNKSRNGGYDGNMSGGSNSGNISTGNASNSNQTSAQISITNGDSYQPSSQTNGSRGSSNTITNTGPHSNNIIVANTATIITTTNTNNISLNNTNYQTATSGNITVTGNSRSNGSIQTGDATNSNTANFAVSIVNN